MQAASLAKIVTDWIKRDPLLKKHIRCDVLTPTEKPYTPEGYLIACCTPSDAVPYAIGFINCQQCIVSTWSWAMYDVGLGRHRSSSVDFYPGDPQFFEKLKQSLITAHNSLTDTHQCLIL